MEYELVPPTGQGQAELLAAAVAEGPVAVACEPTAEGVLSAIGVVYLAHAASAPVRLLRAEAAQPRLGERLIELTPDVSLAQRVHAGMLRAATGPGGAQRHNQVVGGRRYLELANRRAVPLACACDHEDMPQRVIDYAHVLFARGRQVPHSHGDAAVSAFRELVSFADGELEHTRQFVRFSRMADGSYAASFRPQADVIPFALPYFAERMGEERFCLVDPVHCVAALYEGSVVREVACQGGALRRWEEALDAEGDALVGAPRGRRAVVRLEPAVAQALAERRDIADDEAYVRSLWKHFYDAMALPGRGADARGYDLRKQWEPVRFWSGLTELDPRNDRTDGPVPARYQG